MTQAPETQDPQAPVFVVDYTSADVLLALFEEHQIDTVVSCLRIDSEEMAAAQSNSITAADKSKTTKRFLASNWAPPIADPSVCHMARHPHHDANQFPQREPLGQAQS
jgi:hypothetical protein